MTITIRTRDYLDSLLETGQTGNWVIGNERFRSLDNNTKIKIYDWE
jgi:hypothetical protein